jgi:hypothetical protein
MGWCTVFRRSAGLTALAPFGSASIAGKRTEKNTKLLSFAFFSAVKAVSGSTFTSFYEYRAVFLEPVPVSWI